MKKTVRRLTLQKESLCLLNRPEIALAAAAIGRTTEATWNCPTASACSHCPLCA